MCFISISGEPAASRGEPAASRGEPPALQGEPRFAGRPPASRGEPPRFAGRPPPLRGASPPLRGASPPLRGVRLRLRKKKSKTPKHHDFRLKKPNFDRFCRRKNGFSEKKSKECRTLFFCTQITCTVKVWLRKKSFARKNPKRTVVFQKSRFKKEN